MTPLLSIRNLGKRFPGGEIEVTVLHDLDLDIYAGEMWPSSARPAAANRR